MARYIVKIAFGGRSASLLVVLSSNQLCSTLVDPIRHRLPTIATKLDLATVDDLSISLHLDTEDGPLIDTEDLLSNFLTDTKEIIYAVIEVSDLAYCSSETLQMEG